MKDKLDTLGAWALGLLWILPLAYAVWAAFHPPAYATRFDLFAPLTLDNFARAWQAAPFPRYFANTFLLVTMVLAAQLVLSTLAGYAFARFEFRGRDFVFMLVLLQLMIMPDVLLVENYRSMSQLGIRDTVFAIGLPYFASAFGIFLLRQTFKTSRASWRRPRAWRAPTPCRCCGRCTCRWPSRSTWPTGWCRSATTGTISCGR